MRKVIQITESAPAEFWNLTALCDDGSMWVISNTNEPWVRLNDVPQPDVRSETNEKP